MPPFLRTGHYNSPGVIPSKHQILATFLRGLNTQSGHAQAASKPGGSLRVFFKAMRLYKGAQQQSSPDTGCHRGSCSHGCSAPAKAGAHGSNVAALCVIHQCHGMKMPTALLICLPALPVSQRRRVQSAVVGLLTVSVWGAWTVLRDKTVGELLRSCSACARLWTTSCSVQASFQNNSDVKLSILEKSLCFQRWW